MTDVVGRRRPRTARWISIAVGVVLLALVGVLATRDSAASRLVKSPLLEKPVPALSGTAMDGTAYDIDDQRGGWVLVNFFATWCQPCIEEHDDLDRLADGGRIDVVSVVFSDDEEDVERFFEERGGDWPVLADDDGAVATTFGVARVPESYLVAPSGIVVGKVTGGISDAFVLEQIDRLEGRAS